MAAAERFPGPNAAGVAAVMAEEGCSVVLDLDGEAAVSLLPPAG
jgi:hypothetical protein